MAINGNGILIIPSNYYYLWILDVLLEEKMPLWIAIIIIYQALL